MPSQAMLDNSAPAYVGRFAPSPTGPLHAGSMVAALASWLDAKAHRGKWLLRIEDVDAPRCVPGADRTIIRQLADCGLHPDEPPTYQSQRSAQYQAALSQLLAARRAYPCSCSRQDIEAALLALSQPRARGGELIYPGTCRHGLAGKAARSWRFAVSGFDQLMPVAQQKRAQAAPVNIANHCVCWADRELGNQSQDVAKDVGDFILKRADGLWAYQLAVVVDDASQHITHVVRGADLLDNTARQIELQRALCLAQPSYLHVPVVNAPDGQKLSKQNGALPVHTATAANALLVLQAAGAVLGLQNSEGNAADWLTGVTRMWAKKYRIGSS